MGGGEYDTPFSHVLFPLSHLFGKSVRTSCPTLNPELTCADDREIPKKHITHAVLAAPIRQAMRARARILLDTTR
jgi:hypothetical protein